jgi:uncharacterized protein YbjT (DUF2867 family)
MLHRDVHTIRASNEIVSCWATARIPLVATDDIAQAAFDSIVAGQQSAKEVIILGPQALTYDEVRIID